MHPLLNSLLNPIQRTYSKKVTSLVILAISDEMVNFFLIKLCFVLYVMSEAKAPSQELEREKGEKQIVSSFPTLQVGERGLVLEVNFGIYALN